MKPLPDDSIREAFKNVERYEIKTTAEDILLAAGAQPVVEKKTRKPFFKPFLITFASTAAVAATIAVLVVQPWQRGDSGDHGDLPVLDILNPQKNKFLSDELMAFHAFSNGAQNDRALALRKAAIRVDEEQSDDEVPEEENDSGSIDEALLGQIADRYEPLQSGIRSLFEAKDYEVVTVEKEAGDEFVYEGKTFTFETRFLDDDSNILARLYFNPLRQEEDDGEVEVEMEALYSDNESYFHAFIERESETEHDEQEEEVKTMMWSVDPTDPRLYVVEKEHEFSGTKSEDSYSYKTYASRETYERDEDDFLSAISFEMEEGEINAVYETPKEEETEFRNIKRHAEDHYSFRLEEWTSPEDISVEKLDIDLRYEDDFATRIYSSVGVSVRKP